MRCVKLGGWAAFFIAFGLASSASGQDYNRHLYGSWQNLTFPLDYRIMQETVMAETRRKEAGAQPVPAPPMRFDFNPSSLRRKANLESFIGYARRVDPQGAAEMEKLTRSTDIIDQIDQQMHTSFGLRANNVADAYAVWWMNAWQAAHGDLSDASRAKAQAVRAQAASALAATPEFRSANDAAKQEFAEALLIQAALIGASAEAYANDPGMMHKLGEAVRQGASASGLDLDTMTLTDDGFVPAGD